MSPFLIKRGDTAPWMAATLLVGVATVDLTGASVFFVMKGGPCATTVIRKPAVIVNVAGQVRYEWATGDTSVAGHYRGEFEIVLGSQRITHPSIGFIPITIIADQG